MSSNSSDSFICDGDKVIYRVIYVKSNKKCIHDKNIATNTYRIDGNEYIMCGYFCIEFINFILKGKSFLDYTILFSPNKYEMNDKITLKYFQ